MKPLSKAQQATLAKNRGIPVREGLAVLNARGKKLPVKHSLLALAVAATVGKNR